MKKVNTTIISLIILFMVLIPTYGFAEQKSVPVTLPDFPIKLNGYLLNNGFREYPLIQYHDTTYMPMTYYDARFLGIETKWNDQYEKIFTLNKTDVTAGYKDLKRKRKNKKVDRAMLSTSTIMINNQIINKIPPFLLYRNVTYVPIMKNFCEKEFGWVCKFDRKNGLVIDSPNKRLQKDSFNNNSIHSIIIVNDFCYYAGEEGVIYQSPIHDLSKQKKVYQLPMWSYGDDYVIPSLSEENNEAYLTYHQGGAVMGTNYHVHLKEDGTYEEDTYYGVIKRFKDVTIKIYQGPQNRGDNLWIKYENEEFKKIGNPEYLYGCSDVGDCVYLINDSLYLIGAKTEKDKYLKGICKVNIHTGTTSKISNLEIGSFTIEGDYIYTISAGKIYKISLINGTEELLKSEKALAYDFKIQSLGENIYYVHSLNEDNYDDRRLYKIGSSHPLNHGHKVTGIKIEDDYLIATFKEENNNPYRIILYNKEGKIAFKTSDVADINAISIEKGILRYVENTTKNMYSINLNE
ncbi:DUF5050 domain-containing protein [Crassaminicella profunda]|uniref:DUF5050 domain-containing protein n=1 Tax=Crassaminicella profunda TaxID=1286698 RepID=UPI001CA70156|nr:DUF5050 domain-containing protein [Crassaminicella profunda]QZY55935.1 DUF5050 domain-containing protein [Crassaminicella profunda]